MSLTSACVMIRWKNMKMLQGQNVIKKRIKEMLVCYGSLVLQCLWFH